MLISKDFCKVLKNSQKLSENVFEASEGPKLSVHFRKNVECFLFFLYIQNEEYYILLSILRVHSIDFIPE